MNTDRQPNAGMSHSDDGSGEHRAAGEADGDAHHQRDPASAWG